ncbi:MAG TPA: hypothetical protein ENH07_10330 [Nitrospirae bacterium]|nr:hypothetical protein [Nitrospirota bacterium]
MNTYRMSLHSEYRMKNLMQRHGIIAKWTAFDKTTPGDFTTSCGLILDVKTAVGSYSWFFNIVNLERPRHMIHFYLCETIQEDDGSTDVFIFPFNCSVILRTNSSITISARQNKKGLYAFYKNNWDLVSNLLNPTLNQHPIWVRIVEKSWDKLDQLIAAKPLNL